MTQKKTGFKFLASLLCLSLTIDLFSLPKDIQVKSGTSSVKHVDSHTMEIRPSDHAIINYSKFDIAKEEKVRFIQDSSSSCVLNRVRGKNPSEILGSLESNGRVFLVNPNGIYFGPNSQVNVGSLIASTLDISNTDFLQENYSFSLSNANAGIINEGVLNSKEGSIALISPKIQNMGSITARAGSVVLTSGEHVTLDFTGDGLIQFSTEGTLKESLIEQLGDVTASVVQIKIPAAKKAISEIVNMDGIEEGDIFIEENGVIKFASGSSVESKKILIEAANLEVKGSFDATNLEGQGGEVHFFGKDITLDEATINASGSFGGGEVLIGGEYQGKGDTPWASKVIMSEDSLIFANALNNGDAGTVVLWSKDQTLFNGKIEAKGGMKGGNGGSVETSSQLSLEIITGQVDTSSNAGRFGLWLLDPWYVAITDTPLYPSCTSTAECDCTTICTIAPSIINTSNSPVDIKAFGIFVSGPITMQNNDIGLSFTGCPGCGSSIITFSNSTLTPSTGPSITTLGGNVTFTDSTVILYNDLPIVTNGGDVNIPFIEGFDSSRSVTINAGGGAVDISTTTDNNFILKSLNIKNVSQVSTSGIKTGGGSGFVMPTSANLILKTSPLTIDTSVGNGPMTLGNISGSGKDLTLNAGTGSITLGDGSSFVASLTITSASSLVAGSLFADPGSLNINLPVTLSQSSTTFSSTGGDVSFSSTLSPNASGLNLTLYSSSGTVTLPDLESNMYQIGNVTLTGNSVILSSSLNALGSVTVNNSGIFDLNAGPISAGGNFSQTGIGAVSLDYDILAEGKISFSSDITITDSITLEGFNGLEFDGSITPNATGLSLTLNAGTKTVEIPQAGSDAFPLDSLSIIGGSVTLSNAIKTSSLSVQNSSVLNITTLPILLSGAFQQIGTSTTTLEQNITASSVSFAKDLILKGDNITISATAGDLSFAGISESNSNIQTLNLAATGMISTVGTLSTNILSIPSAPVGISVGNYLTLTDSCTITAVTGDISIGGNFEVTGTNGVGTLTASAGNISVDENVEVEGSSGVATLTANSGTVLIGNELKATNLTVSAVDVTVGRGISFVSTGQITATGSFYVESDISSTGNFTISAINASLSNMSTSGGAILVDSPVTIQGSNPSITSSGGSVTFTNSILPGSTTPNLNIDAGSGDVTVTGSIGSESSPFNDITVIGCEVNISDYYANDDINIVNCSTLTMPQKNFSVGGDFVQSGVGPVSLEFNITVGEVLYFTGPVTITKDLTLIGNGGIDFEGSIFAGTEGLSLSLEAPNSLVVLHDIGEKTLPFSAVYIIGDTVAYKGEIESSILQFNGEDVVSTIDPNIESLFNSVPKSNFFVPGLYSSWETFFDDEYFQVSPVNFIDNN